MLRFLPASLAVLVLACGIGALLSFGFEHRFYGPIVFPLGAFMAVGGLALLAVRLGRCRSQWAAVLLGLVAGFLIHPGQHVVAWLADDGLPALRKPADLLEHMDGRFSREAIDWGLPPRLDDDQNVEPTPLDRKVLWASAGLELLLAILFVGLPPLLRVRREPFCEASGQWMDLQRLAFSPGADEALLEALETGRLSEVAKAAVIELHPNQASLLGLFYTCSDLTCTGAPGYLSLRRTRGDAAVALAMEALFPFHRLRLRCAELNHDEATALSALRPGESTAAVIPTWIEEVEEHLMPPGRFAETLTVNQPEPPPAATPFTRRWAETMNLLLLLGFVALGLGLLVLASVHEDEESRRTVVLGVSGFAVMLAGLAIALRDPNFAGDRYLMRRLGRRVAARTDRLVAPADPEVLQVALVPRSVWGNKRGQELIDHGLLTIRPDSVLFEGDRKRMTIPAESILTVGLEPLTVDQYHTWHFVVLELRTKNGRHTLPLIRICCPLWETLLRSKKKRSQVLLARILLMLEDGSGGGWRTGESGELRIEN